MEDMAKQIKVCNYCDLYATSLCFKCNNYFCEECFKLIHERKKEFQEHKKEKLDPFISIEIKCPIHPINSLSLFCVDEKGKLTLYYFY